MSKIADIEETVRDVLVRHPETRPVFERFGVDYCCGGARTLGKAAAEAGANPDELVQALGEAAGADKPQPGGDLKNWAGAPLSELADHIVQKHHAFLKEHLHHLDSLMAKVTDVHGERHGELLDAVRKVFTWASGEIEMHLKKEEEILFPYIRQIEAYARGEGPRPQIHCGTVANPIRQMEAEHEKAGEALLKIRELTSQYTLPDDACYSFGALYDGFEELERDMHLHIHLENNILFPRTIEMERETLGG